jgi:hypothetical protein
MAGMVGCFWAKRKLKKDEGWKVSNLAAKIMHAWWQVTARSSFQWEQLAEQHEMVLCSMASWWTVP